MRFPRLTRFLRFILTPLTALWLLWRPRREVPEVAVQPIVEDEREEEQETCGHNDRRIPLNPRCPKCAALLAPVDWAFIDKMENGGGLAAQLFPEALPGDHRQRAFPTEPVQPAQLGDEEMTILHGDAWLVPEWRRKLARRLTLTEKSESYSGPMQKLLAVFTLTLTFLSNLKARADSLANAVSARDSLIADLKGQLDAGNADHSSLLARVDAAEKHSAELDAVAPELEAKADELVQAINDHPDTPNIDPATLAITQPAPAAENEAPAEAPAAEGGAAQ